MLYFSKWKTLVILAVVGLGFLFALPNVLPKSALKDLQGFMPSKRINLGLDLRGGAYLEFEVDISKIFTERLESKKDEFRTALRPVDRAKTRIGYKNMKVRGDRINLVIRDVADLDEALKRIRRLRAPVGGGLIGLGGANDVEVNSTSDGQVTVQLTDAAKEEIRNNTLDQSIEVIRRRVDVVGIGEPSIQRQGFDRIVLQMPGVEDTGEIIRMIGKTAKMSFQAIERPATTAELKSGRGPVGTSIYRSDEQTEPGLVVRNRVIVGGDNLTNSQPMFDSRQGGWVVTMTFDSSGSARWAKWTKDNVGRRFAVILDGVVISSPRVQEPILGGTGQIYGNFTAKSADELSKLLRAGALPAKLTIVQQRTVGSTLGADSIAAGEIAVVIGFASVIVYILISYGLFGVYANVALLANLAMIVGVLSLLQATLTLPGIAGIVLTIGMAVDANVLIFERIREEMRAGKTPINSVEAGYQRALATILDANITTFLAGIILFMLGSGPIRGFAVTLSIGIVTSVFTAFVLTRLMIAVWLRRTRPQSIPI